MGLLSYFGLTKQELAAAPDDEFWYTRDPIHNFAYPNAGPSGVNVTESVAMTYSVCWAATSLLGGTGGFLPFNLHKRMPGGGSEIDYNHEAQRIIHDEPNPEMSAMMFRCSRINHQVNRGGGFAEILRDRRGRVKYLYPIHASRIPRQNVIRRNGRLVYKVNNPDGTKTEIPQEDMFHVPSVISDDGIVGLGVVENARLTIGGAIATETHGAAYFANHAKPPVYLKNGKFRKTEDADDFRRRWMEIHGGPTNTGKIALLPPDAELGTLPFNAEESQFLQTRQHSVEELCRWYGVPPHLVHHLLRMTNNNIEHVGIDFVKYSLMKWLKLWEQEVWRKLLTPDEQKTHYAKFNVDALERGDLASRTASMVQEVFNGKRTLNEWRQLDDQNPIGPLGDLHWVQQAMVPLEIAAKGPQEPEPPLPDSQPKDDEDPKDDGLSAFRKELEELRETLHAGDDRHHKMSHAIARVEMMSGALEVVEREQNKAKQAHAKIAAALLRDAMARMLSIEIHSVKHIAEKPNKFDQRLREFYDKHKLTMTRSLVEPVSVMLTVSGNVRPPAEVVESITASHVAESLRQLDALTDCTGDELFGRVETCVSTWHDERASVSV